MEHSAEKRRCSRTPKTDLQTVHLESNKISGKEPHQVPDSPQFLNRPSPTRGILQGVPAKTQTTTTPQRSPLHYVVSSTLNQVLNKKFQRTEVSTGLTPTTKTPQRSPLHYGVSSLLNQVLNKKFQQTEVSTGSTPRFQRKRHRQQRRQTKRCPLHFSFPQQEVSTNRSFNGIDTDNHDATARRSPLHCGVSPFPNKKFQHRGFNEIDTDNNDAKPNVVDCTFLFLSQALAKKSQQTGKNDTYYNDAITLSTAQWRVFFPHLPFDKLFGQQQLKVKATGEVDSNKSKTLFRLLEPGV